MECYELPGGRGRKQGSLQKAKLTPGRPQGQREKPDNPYGLSLREMAVLFLLTEGLADKEIATILGVTAYTVNKHVGAILAKMQARSRTAAAVRATREHIFPGDAFKLLGSRLAAYEEARTARSR